MSKPPPSAKPTVTGPKAAARPAVPKPAVATPAMAPTPQQKPVDDPHLEAVLSGRDAVELVAEEMADIERELGVAPPPSGVTMQRREVIQADPMPPATVAARPPARPPSDGSRPPRAIHGTGHGPRVDIKQRAPKMPSAGLMEVVITDMGGTTHRFRLPTDRAREVFNHVSSRFGAPKPVYQSKEVRSVDDRFSLAPFACLPASVRLEEVAEAEQEAT